MNYIGFRGISKAVRPVMGEHPVTLPEHEGGRHVQPVVASLKPVPLGLQNPSM